MFLLCFLIESSCPIATATPMTRTNRRAAIRVVKAMLSRVSAAADENRGGALFARTRSVGEGGSPDPRADMEREKRACQSGVRRKALTRPKWPGWPAMRREAQCTLTVAS